MTTITQQLADALQNLLDDTEGGVVTPDSVIAEYRGLLAAYHDAARPLEVGDRVRIMHGGYASHGYAVDDETVVRALNAGGCDTLVTCKPFKDTSGHRNGLTFKACDLVRIP